MTRGYGRLPRRIGGRRPPVDKPALHLRDFLTSAPAAPITAPEEVDNTTGVDYALDRNDQFGVCVPTGWDNLRRTVTRLLTGQETDATWDDILAWYRSQNPHFDPATGADDNGMAIQDFLAWLVKRGYILGFAKVDPRDEDTVHAAMYLFLGLIGGATLQQAQQAQTDQGRWDYVPGSPDWGGHCIMFPAYRRDLDKCVTWDVLVDTTPEWRQGCLEELYAVILPEHVAHPGFRAGFDLPKFAEAFTQITGYPFPANVTQPPNPPAPPPRPEPLVAAARALAADTGAMAWSLQHHAGQARHVAALVRAVIRAAS